MKINDDPVGVYILRDIDNGKRYVGQGKKVISRALEHFTDTGKNPQKTKIIHGIIGITAQHIVPKENLSH